MKYLPLILKHLRKNWIRTASTVMAMALCIFLFCTLETLINAISWNLKSASSTRIVTRHAVGIANNLPISYKQRIANIPGVKAVSALNWFGGRQGDDFKNFFPNLAVEPEVWMPMYPEYELPEEQKQAWYKDLRGCIIGRKTADKFGWKIGSTFQLESFIPPYRVGKPFEFVVRGIYDADEIKNPGTDTTAMYFHWKYLYEATGQRVGAGTYYVLIDDPNKAGEISRTIDTMFENSDPQTKTETEAAFRASFISLAGNLALLLRGIGLAVTFTILLVTANTMSMAVRDRRNEIAVLKTLGFPSGLVMALIIIEAIILGVLGGTIGLLLSSFMIQALPNIPFGLGDAVRGFPNLRLTAPVSGIGMGMAIMLGLFAGFVPAFVAYRARITEMLRQV